MINSDAWFVGCENLPSEMSDKLDVAWHFVGEVHKEIYVYCWICDCSPRDFTIPLSSSYVFRPKYHIVDLHFYRFIADDMILVGIFWGVCRECGKVYWARQGPPFKRLRQLVAV